MFGKTNGKSSEKQHNMYVLCSSLELYIYILKQTARELNYVFIALHECVIAYVLSFRNAKTADLYVNLRKSGFIVNRMV